MRILKKKYLKSNNKHSFLISILWDKINDFNPREFGRNPTKYEIPDEIGAEVMLEIRAVEIEELRNVKNAINGALLAKYVDNVPQSFNHTISYAILEF